MLSIIPELTPRPAIGWIVWAASPTKAILSCVYAPDCKVANGNDKRLLTIYVISGISL
jgi:hypothetical protein